MKKAPIKYACYNLSFSLHVSFPFLHLLTPSSPWQLQKLGRISAYPLPNFEPKAWSEGPNTGLGPRPTSPTYSPSSHSKHDQTRMGWWHQMVPLYQHFHQNVGSTFLVPWVVSGRLPGRAASSPGSRRACWQSVGNGQSPMCEHRRAPQGLQVQALLSWRALVVDQLWNLLVGYWSSLLLPLKFSHPTFPSSLGSMDPLPKFQFQLMWQKYCTKKMTKKKIQLMILSTKADYSLIFGQNQNLIIIIIIIKQG